MGFKFNGKEIFQVKKNGKYLWGAKLNGKKVFKDNKGPAVPVLTANDMVNVLQNNTNVSSATKAFSWTPAESNLTGGVWSIVSSSGFPMTLSINASTGVVTGSAPSATDSGSTALSITLRYTMDTRHGKTSADITVNTSRIVAPYFAFTSPSVLTIGTAITSVSSASYSGSDTTAIASTLCSGLTATRAARGVTLAGTPSYDSNDWALTTGLAVPQSIVLSNEAGSYTKSWTVERRFFYGKMTKNVNYKIKTGGKMAILSAIAATLTKAEYTSGGYVALWIYQIFDGNYFSMFFCYDYSETTSLIYNATMMYPNTSFASSTWTSVNSGRRTSQILSVDYDYVIKSGSLNTIAGNTIMSKDVTIRKVTPLSAVDKEVTSVTNKINAAFNTNLYITG